MAVLNHCGHQGCIGAGTVPPRTSLPKSFEWGPFGCKQGDSLLYRVGPNIPFAVLEHGLYAIGRQAIGIAGIVAVTDEPAALPVQFKQSIAVRAEPKIPGPVLEYRSHTG